jgi:hypothetical protein
VREGGEAKNREEDENWEGMKALGRKKGEVDVRTEKNGDKEEDVGGEKDEWVPRTWRYGKG